ncbi:hypothetical protein ACFQU2_28855 [Siccirubricoccus deserti]
MLQPQPGSRATALPGKPPPLPPGGGPFGGVMLAGARSPPAPASWSRRGGC